jgi:hypothetical protein
VDLLADINVSEKHIVFIVKADDGGSMLLSRAE